MVILDPTNSSHIDFNDMDRMTKPKSKFKDNSFHIVSKDDLIEVWLGEPNDGESEYIFSINKFWLPELIDALEEVR